MSKTSIAFAAALPFLMSGLPIYAGATVMHGAMLKHGIEKDPVRYTREFAWSINDPGEFWLGVGFVFVGVLSAWAVLWLGRAAARQAPDFPAPSQS